MKIPRDSRQLLASTIARAQAAAAGKQRACDPPVGRTPDERDVDPPTAPDTQCPDRGLLPLPGRRDATRRLRVELQSKPVTAPPAAAMHARDLDPATSPGSTIRLASQALRGRPAYVAIALLLIAAALLLVMEIRRGGDDRQRPPIPAPRTDASRGRTEIANQVPAVSPDLAARGQPQHAMAGSPDLASRGQPPDARAIHDPPREDRVGRGRPPTGNPTPPARPARDPVGPTKQPPSATGVDGPVALGEIDRTTIQRYVNRHQQRIRHCYEQRRLASPTLAGTVQAQFLITPSGSVASSTATGLDAEVASCVARVLQDIEFPRSGDSIQVTYPFHFVPSD